MDIVILGSAHPLRAGGITTFNERLAQELQTQHHKVEIYSYSLQYPSFLFPGQSQFTTDPAPEGVCIRSVVNSINPINWLKVGYQLNKKKPELIIVRYWLPLMAPCLGTILRLVRKNRYTTVLCIADNILPHEKRVADMLLTRYFIKSVDAFVTMSKKVSGDLRKLSSKPIQYNLHPLYDNYILRPDRSDARKKLGISTTKKVILFFGFIRKYKGLDLLLEAMKDEGIQREEIELIIAGEFYEGYDNYLAMMEDSEIKDRIHLYPKFIPTNEVGYFFEATDAVVLPYRGGSQSGVTQLAFHYHKPVIVTNVGGISEVVINGTTGLVTEPNSKSIAEAILNFFDQASRINFTQNIVKENGRFSWQQFINALLDFTPRF